MKKKQPPISIPDRGHLTTERRLTAASKLDTLSTRRILRLINDQDTSVPAAVRRAIPSIERLVAAVERAFRNGGRLVYLGAGTSGRLGVLDASECPPTYHTDPGMVVGIIAGGDSALRKSSEGAEDDFRGVEAEFRRLKISGRDVVVGIAAGGTTPYVWGGLRFAKSRGATTAIITCVRLSQVSGLRSQDSPPDHVIELLVGPEIITGSTRMKAGTATKLALNMITAASMVRIGKTWGNLMVDLRATNNKLIDRAARIISQQTGLPRPEAIELLQRADGRVKTALVMARRNISSKEAAKLLARNHGRLRPILGTPA
jgi:N-acetylmuramic acid 6-phosphate etherase